MDIFTRERRPEDECLIYLETLGIADRIARRPTAAPLVSRTVSKPRSPSSLSDLTANPLILLKWYYFLEAKLLSLFKGLKFR